MHAKSRGMVKRADRLLTAARHRREAARPAAAPDRAHAACRKRKAAAVAAICLICKALVAHAKITARGR
jgi:hypothetical protein